MSPGAYTFFDIPTSPPQEAWSMNAWRTRLVLNYKGLDYKTEWLEYPEIKPRLEKHVPANEGGANFTLPAIQLPDGSYVMDSYKIADVIEGKHPEPSMHLNNPMQQRLRQSMMGFMGALTAIYVPGVWQRILSEGSQDFFHASREEDVGMPLVEYNKQKGPGSFEKAEPYAKEITALLKENASGPFFLGDTVSYTDFIWAAILLFWKRFGEEEYREVLKRSGDVQVHVDFLDALAPWTKKND